LSVPDCPACWLLAVVCSFWRDAGGKQPKPKIFSFLDRKVLAKRPALFFYVPGVGVLCASSDGAGHAALPCLYYRRVEAGNEAAELALSNCGIPEQA
jgi:hypothetical protein